MFYFSEEGIQKFSVAGSDEVAKGKAAKQQLGKTIVCGINKQCMQS